VSPYTDPQRGAAHAPWLERIDAYPTRQLCGYQVRPGRLLPFGASEVSAGINFSIFSNHATSVVLVLFRRGEAEPMAELPFPPSFRIGNVFAMTVFGLEIEEIEYGYRVYGPFSPEHGHRFDPGKVVLDPYAKMLSGSQTWGEQRYTSAPRGLVAYDDFDWEDDSPLQLPLEDLVIYETHVRGFTRHESSGVLAGGTFAGLTEKIPYLRQLGVNCVELLPVFEFDERDNMHSDPDTGKPLWNYWGYDTLGFFAPKAAYAVTGPQGMQIEEFKNMVKQLHRAGIEVILDVVFNHTAEGNESWSEWNGRYRDTIRRFIKGDEGVTGDMATRLAGSADLYEFRGATASINFITAHDGFTLRDLVSYNEKHNEANGENNQDPICQTGVTHGTTESF
jgi:isoamylase